MNLILKKYYLESENRSILVGKIPNFQLSTSKKNHIVVPKISNGIIDLVMNLQDLKV